MAIILLTSSKPPIEILTRRNREMVTRAATKTTTRTRKGAATAVAPAKRRGRPAADPMKELVTEFVAAIEDGSLDGHLTTLDNALSARAAASGAAKRTRSTAAKKTAAKSASVKPAARTAALKLEDMETGKTYVVKPGTKSARGVDISNQRVTFERKAKKDGRDVAKVKLGDKSILLAPASLGVAGRGRPPKPVAL